MNKVTQKKFEELLDSGARSRGYKSYADVDKTKVRWAIYDEAEMSLESFRNYLYKKHCKAKKK